MKLFYYGVLGFCFVGSACATEDVWVPSRPGTENERAVYRNVSVLQEKLLELDELVNKQIGKQNVDLDTWIKLNLLLSECLSRASASAYNMSASEQSTFESTVEVYERMVGSRSRRNPPKEEPGQHPSEGESK